MQQGYVMLARKLIDSPIFTKPDKWLKIFIFLLIEASHKDHRNLKRGQCFMTYEVIRLKCRATKSVVDHGIHWMKSVSMLGTQKVTGGMIVTILNYDTYQKATFYKGDSDGDTEGTETANCGETEGIQKGYHITRMKECKKNNKNERTTLDDFETFWKFYPRKVGKGNARKWWAKHKPDDKLLRTMLDAIDEQCNSIDWQKDGGQYIPHPTTWLNREGWNDELAHAEYSTHAASADEIAMLKKAGVL